MVIKSMKSIKIDLLWEEKLWVMIFIDWSIHVQSISNNMILSIGHDLSIGFPMSDFIDWSRRVCYDSWYRDTDPFA